MCMEECIHKTIFYHDGTFAYSAVLALNEKQDGVYFSAKTMPFRKNIVV